MDKRKAIEYVLQNIGPDDLITVLNYYGIEIRKNKILCPFPDHHDRHYGSCGIIPGKDVIYCFACGKSTDSVGLVQMRENFTFYEAIEFLWTNILGRPMPEYTKEKKEYIPVYSKELQFIGLQGCGGKYVRQYVNVAYKHSPLPEGYFIDREHYDELGMYDVYQKERMDSIYDLMRDDPEAALFLVNGKCKEFSDYYEQVLLSCPSEGSEEMIRNAQYWAEIKEECQYNIKYIENLLTKIKKSVEKKPA